MNILAKRLTPGQDLYTELQKITNDEALDAAVILSAVGSFTKTALRFANQDATTILDGPHEIVSATGTLSRHGLHIHVSVSDSQGKTIGGHLTPGSSIYTTVELVILDLSDRFDFDRALCPQSKFEELVVRPKIF